VADIEGLHHVTAIAGEPQTNINFYTGVLGLRLVKLTVNFDDPPRITCITEMVRGIREP
jgi:glyoxalase family protein